MSAEGKVRLLGSAVVAASLALALVGVAIIPFLNPVWLGLEQDRADAAAWTGWSRAQVSEVTGGLLHDLVLGPADFAMTVDGQPVFDERERAHMRDVRGVFAAFALAALAGVLVVAGARRASGGAAWFWRGIAAGGSAVAGAVAVLALFFGLAFDTAFELFHSIFFPAGSYNFDPRTARLVQLLPEKLWFETSLAFGVVLFGLAVAAIALGRDRLARVAAA